MAAKDQNDPADRGGDLDRAIEASVRRERLLQKGARE